MSASQPLWDLTNYFPSIESSEFQTEFESVTKAATEMLAGFDDLDIRAGDPIPFSNELVTKAESVLENHESVVRRANLIRAYLSSFVTTDSTNELALGKSSEFQSVLQTLGMIGTRLTAWVGRLPIDELCNASELAQAHRYGLERLQTSATKLMSESEETLATEMEESGSGAWGRLYGNYTSQIKVEFDGQEHAISAIRTFAYDDNQDVRKRAYEKELATWKEHELVIASAMNSIKYESALLRKKRGWEDVLSDALFATAIDRDTLSAMLQAAQDSFPIFRRYMRAKSKALGNEGALPFYDLFAPLGDGGSWTYEEAKSFVSEGFYAFSDRMGDLATRSYNENWIDVPPKPGKRDGAFCMGTVPGESRILMNFKPSFGSVATLAHELGHAYHNLCLKDRTALQSQLPMTLAETASIFCETIIKRRAIASTSGSEKLAILEASLQGANQVVVDITSRYLFETDVFAKRKERELSATELCSSMESAQKATYGDGMDPEFLHPYMWAVKPHYYAWRSFYNYPYMFGMLFGLGLYAVYEAEPNGFQDRYDALLSETGMADAASLGERFGIDIRKKEFWAESLKVIEQDVAEFEKLV